MNSVVSVHLPITVLVFARRKLSVVGLLKTTYMVICIVISLAMQPPAGFIVDEDVAWNIHQVLLGILVLA